MGDSEPESVQPPSPPTRPRGSWLNFGRRLGQRRPASIDAGQPASPGPTSPLFSTTTSTNDISTNDYGTLPRNRSAYRIGPSRRGSSSPSSPIVTLPSAGLGGPGGGNLSRASSTSIFRTFRRPKSAYDRVLEQSAADEANTYINGIRFYYSTFTSIDWLHDAIKDSTRVLNLRRRRSLRGRLVNALDRSLGAFAAC